MKKQKVYFSRFHSFGAYVLIWLLLQLVVLVANAQNISNIKQYVSELSSEYFCGRGYEHQGDLKAAVWIAEKFEKSGLKKFNDTWFQNFTFSINTLPGNVELKIDGKKLEAGKDFILRKSCKTTDRTYNIIHISNTQITDQDFIDSISAEDVTNLVPALDIDFVYANYKDHKALFDTFFKLAFPAHIYITANPLRSYAMYGLKLKDHIIIEMASGILQGTEKQMNLIIDTHFEENYTTQNVIGCLKGKSKPDEYIIIGGHYDHLGMMGKHTFFPGADDNASGVGVIAEFAEFFSETTNRPDCSVIFICFGAEEAGLIGSEFFVNNCPVEHEKIRAVINLDMIAYGQNGFKIEKGDIPDDFIKSMNEIIQTNNLDLKFHIAEAQAHSDHYPFIEAGIPAIFVTSGVEESKDYHTVNDTYESLSFPKIEELVILLREFIYHF